MPLALFTDSTPLTPIRNLFNTIIQQLNKQEVVNYADLDALPSTAGLAEATRAHVDELNVDFQVQDGTWVQVGSSRFASTSARDTAYAKAAGAYLVANVRALVTATTPGLEYAYDGSVWRLLISGGQTPTSVVVGSGSSSVASDGTVSFTGASTVSLNGVFDDPTASYEVIVALAHSASGTVNLRMRAAGADTASNYSYVLNITTLSAGPTRSSSGSAAAFGFLRSSAAGTNGDLRGRYTLFTPKAASAAVLIEGASAAAYNGDRYHVEEMGLVASGASGFDGISIIASAGTMTGSIKVVKL